MSRPSALAGSLLKPFVSYSTDVSEDLKDLLLKMLDKNPESRISIPQIKVTQPDCALFWQGFNRNKLYSRCASFVHLWLCVEVEASRDEEA